MPNIRRATLLSGGSSALLLAACSGATNFSQVPGLFVKPGQGKRKVVLSSNHTISKIQFPLPRPDGSIPPTLEKDHKRAKQHKQAGSATRSALLVDLVCDVNCNPNPIDPGPAPDMSVSANNATCFAYTSTNYREIYVGGTLHAQYFLDGPLNGLSVPYRYATQAGSIVSGNFMGLRSMNVNTTYQVGSVSFGVFPGQNQSFANDPNNNGVTASVNPNQAPDATGNILFNIVPMKTELIPGQIKGLINCAADVLAATAVDIAIALFAAFATGLICAASEGVLCIAASTVIGGLAYEAITAVNKAATNDCLAGLVP